MKYLLVILLLVTALAINVKAQQGQGGTTAKVVTEIIASSSTTVVKGAPFSAEAVSESVQVLSDGNKITRSNTTRMFRDGEGRVRREGDSASGSGIATYYGSATSGFGSGFQDTISIFDPVRNFRYFLNPSAKTVRRISTKAGFTEGAVVINSLAISSAAKAQIETNAVQKAQVVLLQNVGTVYGNSAAKPEMLGTRNIEGIDAEGTRTTTTIAAGAIGNERPIEIVYERWYSKELQLIVYSRHSDPRFGEQIYRLVNINRSEPDNLLFTPPADYKIIAEPKFNVAAPSFTVVTRKPQ